MAYPTKEATIDDATAWALIDRLMPEALRGPITLHRLATSEPPGPYVMPHQAHYQFASGANLVLDGDTAAKRWTRIAISGGPLGETWQPFGPTA